VSPNGDTFQPQWSPDGEKIYFRWGQGDIAYVPAAGGTIRVVPRTGDKVGVALPNGGNHISPDGERIVWAGGRKTIPGVHLWTMPVTGGEPVRLPMKPDLNSFQPRWSPDGRWIAFYSERAVSGDRELDLNIFVVSSEGGEPRQLTNHTDCFCELSAWSPAGDSIAYACSDSIIRIIPVGGGEPRTVLKADELQYRQGSLAWTLDGTRLIYSAKGRLWTVAAAGGEPTVISTDLDGNILQFALSPDGKSIAFNTPSAGGGLELWLMEDFLSLVKR
jgi:Tol biopolymer transport system component